MGCRFPGHGTRSVFLSKAEIDVTNGDGAVSAPGVAGQPGTSVVPVRLPRTGPRWHRRLLLVAALLFGLWALLAATAQSARADEVPVGESAACEPPAVSEGAGTPSFERHSTLPPGPAPEQPPAAPEPAEEPAADPGPATEQSPPEPQPAPEGEEQESPEPEP